MTGELAGDCAVSAVTGCVSSYKKTNLMKRLHASITLCLVFLAAAGYGQTAPVQKYIERSNRQFIRWFNAAQADSILQQYHPDACLANGTCGTAAIKSYYQAETGKYVIRELNTLTVTVENGVATETGQWRLQLPTGAELSGNYRTEWRKADKRWLIYREEILQ